MKYRKKPVVIEAIQWTGGNSEEIYSKFPECFNSIIIYHNDALIIKTLEGNMTANDGDYIIKGIKGEFYPCREDIFLATYEKVEDCLND
jgi:hypothetical protein